MPPKAKPSAKKWDTYEDYLKSEEWGDIREEVMERDGNQCVFCESRNDLHGHHWKYPTEWNHDDAENVVTLCKACHDEVHADKRAKSRQEYLQYIMLGREARNVHVRARAHLEILGVSELLKAGRGITMTVRPTKDGFYQSMDVLAAILRLAIRSDMLIEE